MRGKPFLTLTTAIGLTMLSGTAMAQEVTLTLHHFLSPKSSTHVNMLAPWAERIEEASDGRIKIEIYPSMSLGGAPPQLVRQAVDGVSDIVWTVNGYTPGLFPRTEVFELPTVFNGDIEATNLAMREMFEEDLAEEYRGLHVLWLHVHAGNALQTADTPVRSPDDTKGMKLRVPNPTANAVVEALGATPVTMPVPELPQALTTGVVDGALIPYEIMPSLQLEDVTNYHIEGPDNERFGGTVFQLSMNEARWNELPDDLKAILTENTGEAWLRELAEVWARADEEAIAAAVEAGNERIILSREEMDAFNAVLAPTVDAWIDSHPDIDGAALVETAREAIARNTSAKP
ncbi:TRAP transporter substrate-binding protein [Acuticoccus sp. M5D2P5]|uniref:TRAP transporter substrate-binding protein n=1 Tax=Acuticoccus kalidii TaxID=2910977 RepID=UPI001F35DED5|nr:TRAP transporter substrate-binding protein [Acuticoccus kalidii]MCF3935804.1 TRAP transporter substrate-binding protein [Acuticoccus kalidii]